MGNRGRASDPGRPASVGCVDPRFRLPRNGRGGDSYARRPGDRAQDAAQATRCRPATRDPPAPQHASPPSDGRRFAGFAACLSAQLAADPGWVARGTRPGRRWHRVSLMTGGVNCSHSVRTYQARGSNTGSRALHLPVGSVSVRRCHRRALDRFGMRPRWTVRSLSVPHAPESPSRIPPALARWSVRSLNERDRQDGPNKKRAPTGPWERCRYTAGSPHARIGPIAHA